MGWGSLDPTMTITMIRMIMIMIMMVIVDWSIYQSKWSMNRNETCSGHQLINSSGSRALVNLLLFLLLGVVLWNARDCRWSTMVNDGPWSMSYATSLYVGCRIPVILSGVAVQWESDSDCNRSHNDDKNECNAAGIWGRWHEEILPIGLIVTIVGIILIQ